MTEVKIKYFDTIPPCTSICVLKTGFLFAACEAGNHALYQFIVSYQSEDSSVLLFLAIGLFFSLNTHPTLISLFSNLPLSSLTLPQAPILVVTLF